MGFDIDGLDDIMQSLDNLAKKAEELSGSREVTFAELFSDEFISSNTNATTMNEFLGNSGFDVSSTESFLAIPDEDWNRYVMENSDFESWEDMQRAAAAEYYRNQFEL